MDIKKYLSLMGQSVTSFAREVGCSPQTVYKYIYGTRFPHRDMQRRVYEVTKGRVTPNDWVGIEEGKDVTPTASPPHTHHDSAE
ncbi:MAG: helix-turn-helix domain-containing protein [Rickettsiales bacterium]|nr:helix-turn-helix domain-containing protein [Rickettsiales bacterium]